MVGRQRLAAQEDAEALRYVVTILQAADMTSDSHRSIASHDK